MVIFLIIIIIYSTSIFYLALRFAFAENDIVKNDTNKTVILLIPFKNEEKNLINLLQDLEGLNYKKENIDIVFINDNSSDKGQQIIEEAIEKTTNISLINLIGETGKKQALKKGLENAKGEIIIHTDADVRLNEEWIKTIVNSFADEKILMCFGSVIFNNEKSFFEKIQSVELLSLSGIAASTGILKHPVLISGANLAYRQELKQDFIDSINNESSGDDMFFLEFIKKKYNNKSIKYIKDLNNLVMTNAEANIKSFINQRVRWAGKTKKIKDLEILSFGMLSILTNISIILLGVFSFFDSITLIFFISSIYIKFFSELISIIIYSNYFKKLSNVFLFPILFVVYPFYVSGIGIISFFVKPKWK